MSKNNSAKKPGVLLGLAILIAMLVGTSLISRADEPQGRGMRFGKAEVLPYLTVEEPAEIRNTASGLYMYPLFSIHSQALTGDFNFPRGIAVAHDGSVYVADTYNHRIQHFSASGTFTETWGSFGDGPGKFKYPESIAVAPNGHVYVADAYNDRIQEFDSHGKFVRQWGTRGSAEGQFQHPRGIAIAPNGNVYVVEMENNRVQYFTSDGGFLGMWGTGGSGVGRFDSPRGIAVAPDGGSVYVADWGNSRVQRFTSSGAFLGMWGKEGSGPGQFKEPKGIAVAPDGTVYVADRNNSRIQQFTPTGTLVTAWGTYGAGPGQLEYPEDIAVSPDGSKIYVADTWNHRVQYFATMGEWKGEWGEEGDTGGKFQWPCGLAVNPDGLLYVADTADNRIQYFSSKGQFLGMWGYYGSGLGLLDQPHGVAVAHDGTVYVADGHNHRIQHFTAGGDFIHAWGTLGSGDSQFNWPCGVAIAPDGSVYVADTNNHRVQHFSSSGVFLGKWGSYGSDDGQFIYPHSLAVSPDGTIYVADRGNHLVQYFDSSGNFRGKWGGYGSGAGSFDRPYGIAAAPDGTIYVADTGNRRIQRFSSTGAFLGSWSVTEGGGGSFSWPCGIAVASDGTVYVADANRNAVYAFGSSYASKWRGEFFANRWLAGPAVFVQETDDLDMDWGYDSPGPGVPSDDFSSRWQKYVWFDGGEYEFTVFADDGVRLWVDDNLVVDQWHDDQRGTFYGTVNLSQGYHKVVVEQYDAGGMAALKVLWHLPRDSYEPDDTCAQAHIITVNGPAQGHNFHDASDVDWVKFSARDGYRYTIETSNLESNADTVIALYEPNCSTLIAEDDNSGPGLGSKIVWNAYSDQEAYVKVYPKSSANTGNNSGYYLSVTAVQFATNTPTPTSTPTPTATPTPTQTPVPYGTVNGVVFWDKNENYVNDTGDEGVPGAYLQISRNGQVVASTISGDDGSYSFTHLSAGTYVLRITPPDTYLPESFDRTAVVVTEGSVATVDFPMIVRSVGGFIPLVLMPVPVTPTATPTATPVCDPYEPNDTFDTSWGPLESGQKYYAKICDGDPGDYYYFDVADVPQQVTLHLHLPDSLKGYTGMWLYSQDDLSNPVCGRAPIKESDAEIMCDVDRTGRYILSLYDEITHDDQHSYVLQVDYR